MRWAEAFLARNPQVGEVLTVAGLAMWFEGALIAGYRAGQSHAPFPHA